MSRVLRFLQAAGTVTIGAVVGYLTVVYVREVRRARADAAHWAALQTKPRIVVRDHASETLQRLADEAGSLSD